MAITIPINKETDVRLKQIVEKGLTGLANAGSTNNGNWFVGHFGAEVLSLAFLLMNKRLEKPVELGVFERIDEIFKTHTTFFETPLLMDNVGAAHEVDDFVKKIEDNIANLRVDAHLTIYSALALRGFSHYPELARPEIIQGLFRLIDACVSQEENRYYKLNPKAFSDKVLLRKFACHSAIEAVKIAIHQHSEVITDRGVDGEFYFFSGSRLHLVTHAHALLELEQMGYQNLVKLGLPAFTKHCICIDASGLPEGAKPYKAKQLLDPRDSHFWQRDKTNPHHAKLAFAVLEIFAALPQENQIKALHDLSAYWELYE
jgi:hypothetical protein